MTTRFYRTILILIVSNMLVLSTTAQDAVICGLSPQVSVGDEAVITPGPPNNVRDLPLLAGERIGQIAAGERFEILNGPVCGDGFTWWQVRTDALTGWTVASDDDSYFMEAVSSAAEAATAFNFNDFTLTIPGNVASDGAGSFVNAGMPVEGTSNADPATRYPPFVELSFVDYVDENTFEGQTAYIHIYTVESFDLLETFVGDDARDTIARLSAITAVEPADALAPETFQPGATPDFSPGVAQAMIANVAYLDFAAGSGIRFLTSYTQGAPLVNNESLLYRYQGISADGYYFIDAQFPLEAPEQAPEPEIPADDPFAVPEGYADVLRTFYEAYAADEFTPTLTALDALIASLDLPPPPSRG